MLSVLSIAIVVALGITAGQATADMVPTPELVAQEFLAEHPGGVLVNGNEVVYPDGSGFVAVDVEVMSVAQCSSDKFCMWSSPNYTGAFSYVTGSGVTKTLTGTVKSFWNNRTKAARLYNNTGTSSTCYAAGVKKASVAVGYQVPAKVYLSAGTSC